MKRYKEKVLSYNIEKIMENLMELSYEINFRMNLRMNSKSIDIHQQVADLNLGPLHVAILAIIKREKEGLTLSSIADKIGVSYATMTNLVDKLEGNKFVERQKDPADRRAVRIAITKNAEDMMEMLKSHHSEALKTYFDSLNEDDCNEMIAAFDKIHKILVKNRRDK